MIANSRQCRIVSEFWHFRWIWIWGWNNFGKIEASKNSRWKKGSAARGLKRIFDYFMEESVLRMIQTFRNLRIFKFFITALLCWNWPQNIQKKNKKKHVLDKLGQFFVQTSNGFVEQNFHWLDSWNNRVFNMQFEKDVAWSSSSSLQRCQNFRIFSIFDNIVPSLGPFQKFTSIRKPICSGLKRVATGSV